MHACPCWSKTKGGLRGQDNLLATRATGTDTTSCRPGPQREKVELPSSRPIRRPTGSDNRTGKQNVAMKHGQSLGSTGRTVRAGAIVADPVPTRTRCRRDAVGNQGARAGAVATWRPAPPQRKPCCRLRGREQTPPLQRSRDAVTTRPHRARAVSSGQGFAPWCWPKHARPRPGQAAARRIAVSE